MENRYSKRSNVEKPHIRWNCERSGEQHFDNSKIRYNFVIYNSSYHDSIESRILEQFTDFSFFQGFEDFEEFTGNKEGTVMKYRFFRFKTTRSPGKIDWKGITSMPVKKDRMLSEKNKKGIENYLSDLYNQ